MDILEELDRNERRAARHHWAWVFRWPPAISALTTILLCLINHPSHALTDRAWAQIDACFHRYCNDDINMSKFSAWRSIEALCDQAMVVHFGRQHAGYYYTTRGGGRYGNVDVGASGTPLSHQSTGQGDLSSGASMQGLEQEGGVLPVPQYLVTPGTLEAMGYLSWGTPDDSPAPSTM